VAFASIGEGRGDGKEEDICSLLECGIKILNSRVEDREKSTTQLFYWLITLSRGYESRTLAVYSVPESDMDCAMAEW
jgi:hypothetical protein